MKQTENNEIDLLLRSMATRASSVSESGNGGPQTAHLDADELNAFAEHSLPSAARTRYTAHLVDCSRCRKLVAELSAAAGLPRTETGTDREVRTSFWQRLPAFLSPAVLRFAVPALAILAVVTVGIIAFRQMPMADFVARQHAPEATSQSPVATKTSVDSPIESPQEAPVANTSSPKAPATSAPSTKEQTSGASKTDSKAISVDGVSTGDTSSGVVAKDATKAGQVAEPEAQPIFAPEPSPPPRAANPQGAATAGDKNEAVAKQKEQDAEGAREVQDERLAAQERGVANLSRGRKAAAAGRGGSAMSTGESRRTEAEQAKPADKYGETREVAGRRFRRQGNGWVDSAYAGARLVMTVVRGSEQYRVLVADEPGIRTIAEALAGEVIVVWKGRAYRIR